MVQIMGRLAQFEINIHIDYLLKMYLVWKIKEYLM